LLVIPVLLLTFSVSVASQLYNLILSLVPSRVMTCIVSPSDTFDTVPSTVLMTAHTGGDSNRSEKKRVKNATIEWVLRSFISTTQHEHIETA